MAVKARLKFPGDLPIVKEMKLIHEGKFVVWARKRPQAGDRGYLIVEKMAPIKVTKITSPSPPPRKFDVLVNGQLEQHVQDELTNRCNQVVAIYLNPDENQPAIRCRLENIVRTLPTKRQSEFIYKWMADNLDVEEPLFLKRAPTKDDVD